MFLALLQMRELGQFAAPESAVKRGGKNGPVPFTFEVSGSGTC
jgi:hypothetical protein